MWKMILYWKKRSETAENIPFYELDIDKIAKAISKTQKFFEHKIPMQV